MADKKEYPHEIALEAGRRYKLHSRARKAFQDGGEFAYQIATDGREELEKKLRVYKIYADNEIAELDEKITALQSQCAEKDQEIEKGNQAIKENCLLRIEIEELKAENERLRTQLAFQESELVKARS